MSLIWQFFPNLLNSVLYSFLWPEYKGLGLRIYLVIYVLFLVGKNTFFSIHLLPSYLIRSTKLLNYTTILLMSFTIFDKIIEILSEEYADFVVC